MIARRAFGQVAATLAILALWTAVHAQTPPAQEKSAAQAKPAALVNSEGISPADVKLILDQRPSPVPLTQAQQKELRQAALDMLIDDTLMRQFLKKNTPPAAPAEIQKEIEELKDALKKQNKTLDQFLKEGKQSEEQLRTDISARVQWKSYLVTRFPETEVKTYYEANKVFFDKVFVRASHILVKLPASASAAEKQTAKAKLETLRNEILAGKLDFAEAAKKHSECPSKDKGGDIGQFPYKFVVVDAFAKAAFSQKVGSISDVVSSEFGLHIIKTTERSDGQSSTFDSVKETVREVMAQDTDLYNRILADQRKAAKIEVFLQ